MERRLQSTMWVNSITSLCLRTHLRPRSLLCRRRPLAARRRRRAALLQAKAPFMHGFIHLNNDGWVRQERRQIHMAKAHTSVTRLGERTVQTALQHGERERCGALNRVDTHVDGGQHHLNHHTSNISWTTHGFSSLRQHSTPG